MTSYWLFLYFFFLSNRLKECGLINRLPPQITLHHNHLISAQTAANSASMNNTRRTVASRDIRKWSLPAVNINTDCVLLDLPWWQLIIIWHVQKFPALRNKKDSLPCSKNHAIASISNPVNLNRTFKIYSCIRQVYLLLFSATHLSLFLRFSNQKFV